MLCLGSNTPNYFEDEGFPALKVIARPFATALHEWCIRNVRDELVRSSRITPADLLLLDYHSKGLGTKQIANALGTSTTCVNSRFQRVNIKLGVLNRRSAARLAARAGTARHPVLEEQCAKWRISRFRRREPQLP